MQNLTLFRTQAYINGTFTEGLEKRTFAVYNPANGEQIAQVACLGKEDTLAAIAGAEAAQRRWRDTTAKERAAILNRWYELIMQNQEQLAYILSLEQGKPLRESLGEIAYGASFIQWFAEEGKRAYGEIIPQDRSDRRLLVIKQPVGVVGAVTPWNFPNAMITRKAAPALAAGCSIIVKPAAETPLSALALAELAQQAGIPPGLFNILTSDRAQEVGEVLTSDKRVRKFTFTGSTRVGKQLMAQCAASVKKISLELGGNAPSLIFNDADLDTALQGVIASKFRNAGQTCVCTNRIYVQSGIYRAFADGLAEKVRSFRVGDFTSSDTDIGPLINSAAVDKIERHIADAVEKGAKIIVGGKPHELGGNFFQPTVLEKVSQQMLVCHEETFAPLAALIPFETEEEAIEMANDSEFGLASYLYTRDMARIWRVAEALESGLVGINEGVISNEVAPFGGVKQSGLGREGSRHGLDEFLEIKYLCMKL
ncbi:succinate semialdehyde dehydrogenase [Mesocricetibacter intestinalis]|uniref:Succinate semialdehyde dehydrogenase n=1 Tax=Mesocricetibacter intestinalis TaxID=1521930 RepID=A0A4R6VBB9_9PAST|nr:NAD-dependent succinate-semialdehyde dehydrogenase [Mesocricetibacter intestinalis]TDQ59548.1 succinate semialdehyde dehydrogenase [Mesocricetibacter intestinalis]